jgi:uncharacterized protein (TIGR01777 family)
MRFLRRTTIGASAESVFAWHARPGAFERLVPPWDRVRVIERSGSIGDGDRLVLQMRVGPAAVRWTAVHRDLVEGRQFVDEQRGGPFARWVHTHRFIEDGPRQCVLEDDIDYEPPLGPIGRLASNWLVAPRLDRTFGYRHAVTSDDILTWQRYAGGPMRVAVTGSSGLIGSHLVPMLSTGGHDVVGLVRGQVQGPGQARWDPSSGDLDTAALGEVDAVVHLAGAGIADRRWSDAYKREIAGSRAGPTEALCRALARRSPRPSVLVCASAIGFYGDRGDEIVDESSPAGDGFLAATCSAWERATAPALDAGIRVVNARIGIVLTPRGGALAKMLPPMLAGVAGRVGSGRQFMSWIAIDDVLGAIAHAMGTPSVRGPMNVTAPSPVTNAEFTATLARVVRRPAVLPVPAFALRAIFGEMGEALLLGGQRVLPRVLEQTGYVFRHASLEAGLRHLLGR